MYYPHAHLFAMNMIRSQKTLLTLANGTEFTGRIIILISKLLTHRYQKGDSVRLAYAKNSMSHHSGLHTGWDLMLLWAEIKEIACIGLSEAKEAELRGLFRANVTSQKSPDGQSPRANGFIGYILAELIMTAQQRPQPLRLADGNTRINQDWIDKALFPGSSLDAFAKAWIERAWFSRSSLETASLCCVLANLSVYEYSTLVPNNWHMLYGYYLSRAGILEDAAHFLTSGLQYNLASPTPLQLFHYLFELISVYLRLDQWEDAGKLLARIEKDVLSGNEGMKTFDFWARSREYGEIRTPLDLYQADYLMATSKLDETENRLADAVSAVPRVRDNYKRSMKVGDADATPKRTKGTGPSRGSSMVNSKFDRGGLDARLLPSRPRYSPLGFPAITQPS